MKKIMFISYCSEVNIYQIIGSKSFGFINFLKNSTDLFKKKYLSYTILLFNKI